MWRGSVYREVVNVRCGEERERRGHMRGEGVGGWYTNTVGNSTGSHRGHYILQPSSMDSRFRIKAYHFLIHVPCSSRSTPRLTGSGSRSQSRRKMGRRARPKNVSCRFGLRD